MSSKTNTDNGFPKSDRANNGANLDKFYADVEKVTAQLKELEGIHQTLHYSNESLQTVIEPPSIRNLRKSMDYHVSFAVNKAKRINNILKSLDAANAANRSIAGCGPGSTTDRARSTVVSGLRMKLKKAKDAFICLHDRVIADYREVVERQYYTVTGQKADERMVDRLVANGGGQEVVAHAIKEYGKAALVEILEGLQERKESVNEMERGLRELQQVFCDMSTVVEEQGEVLNDIAINVERARSFTVEGTRDLQVASRRTRNTRKWSCVALLLVLIFLLVVAFILILPLALQE